MEEKGVRGANYPKLVLDGFLDFIIGRKKVYEL